MEGNQEILRSKTKGALLGTLAGDCFGGPFETNNYSPNLRMMVSSNFDNLDCGEYQGLLPSSSDSRMTRCTVESIVKHRGPDYKHMMQLFYDDYNTPFTRGYSRSIAMVLREAHHTDYEDVFTWAKQLFVGRGSFGNGGAMRIAPVAAFCHKDYETMLEVARKVTELTHTHESGVNGALLQCIAVWQCLHLDATKPLDVVDFVEKLITKMEAIEGVSNAFNIIGRLMFLKRTPSYCLQLGIVKEYLKSQISGKEISDVNVVNTLGTKMVALYSVPTAIYCFLKTYLDVTDQKVREVTQVNKFRATIEYAISLGGDADTIGAMAGAIAGAFYGETEISKNLLNHCEDYDKMLKAADAFCDLCVE